MKSPFTSRLIDNRFVKFQKKEIFMMAFTRSPKWGEGKHFRKRFVREDQKILILEGGCIMRRRVMCLGGVGIRIFQRLF